MRRKINRGHASSGVTAPVPPQVQPTPKHMQSGSHLVHHHDDDYNDNNNNNNNEPPALEDFSDDEKEAKDNNKEEAYKRTKAFGDENHKDHKHKKKEEHSGDLKGVFTQEKGRINPHTQECKDS
jgi:hypothetical protein